MKSKITVCARVMVTNGEKYKNSGYTLEVSHNILSLLIIPT